MTTHTQAIPAGYRKDAQGRLVPEAMVKPIDIARDDLVTALVAEAKAQRAALSGFGQSAKQRVQDFCERSARQYKVKHGGAKGNLTLYSFDGRHMVKVANADMTVFDERLQAAKALIDECIVEWAKDSRPEIKVLVQQAFETDREGKLKTGRVLALTRLPIKDTKWRRAMQAITDSVQVIGTKNYIRFYERNDVSEKYEQISLDVAGA